MPKKILVTGGTGQLGQELYRLAESHEDTFYFPTRSELDMTHKQDIHNFIIDFNIDTVINGAAYTAVDKAETDLDNAYLANAKAVEYLAEITDESNIRLIHISTDFVFDGTHSVPYVETDTTNPLSVYGSSKLAGEQALKAHSNAIILRTSWLYSVYGNNFVKTMRKLGAERDSIGVIFDQIGTPTNTRDLAEFITTHAINSEASGLFHFSNEGVASWYDFAVDIMRISKLKCAVKPIETSQYPTPAKRPAYSVLNKKKLKDAFKTELPHWRESLRKCIKEIVSGK